MDKCKYCGQEPCEHLCPLAELRAQVATNSHAVQVAMRYKCEADEAKELIADLEAQVAKQDMDLADENANLRDRIADLKAQVAEAQQACLEAHQFIGGSLVQEMSEQDSIAIMDKLCNVINKAKEVE